MFLWRVFSTLASAATIFIVLMFLIGLMGEWVFYFTAGVVLAAVFVMIRDWHRERHE